MRKLFRFSQAHRSGPHMWKAIMFHSVFVDFPPKALGLCREDAICSTNVQLFYFVESQFRLMQGEKLDWLGSFTNIWGSWWYLGWMFIKVTIRLITSNIVIAIGYGNGLWSLIINKPSRHWYLAEIILMGMSLLKLSKNNSRSSSKPSLRLTSNWSSHGTIW